MLSSIAQFKTNCPALADTSQSSITDIEITQVIENADIIVIIDLGNLYSKTVIVGSTGAFNLLSQFKSAQKGIEKFYGYSSRETTMDALYYENEYNALLSKLVKGSTIYDKDGNAVSRISSNISYKKQVCTEISTYVDEDS